MPLKAGFSRKVISHNIAKERRRGKRKDVAIAIALSKAEKSRRKRKGGS